MGEAMWVMHRADIDSLATELLASHKDGAVLAPPSERFRDFSLTDGYSVAAEITRRRTRCGERVIGRKIGFSNKMIWSKVGLDSPMWAPIYGRTVHFTDEQPVALSLAGMVAPRIEVEIVFKLRATPAREMEDGSTVLQAVEWLALGLEVVDCHYPEWKFNPADAVADFGLHAALIVGIPRRVSPTKVTRLATQLRDFQVSLLRNGDLAETGTGRNVLGSPAVALGYLTNLIDQDTGAGPLMAGELISTGTLTPLRKIAFDETWRAVASGLDVPAVAATFVTSSVTEE